MKLSFIVVTHHRGPLLQKCLDSIYSQERLPYPCEIIVVDNGGDASIQSPVNADIHLRVERSPYNLGAAGGRNLGMKHATGDYLISIDDDAIWHQPDDVARLVTHLDNNPHVGAVTAHSLDPSGNVIIGELPHPNKRYIRSVTSPVEVPYFYTMGVILRSDAVRLVGGYPERFQIYMEELDLSLRLVDAGYQILYDPSIAVYHHKSNLGRLVVGNKYWGNSALNKMRVAWRLLPFPYPLTILLIWSVAVLSKTHSLGVLLQVWRDLWHERSLLAHERKPIRPDTVRYLKRIGARLTY